MLSFFLLKIEESWAKQVKKITREITGWAEGDY